jgi:hypothetical protein
LAPKAPTQTDAEFSDQMLTLMAGHRLLWYLDYFNPAWDPQHLADTVLPRDLLSLGTEEVAGRGMRLYISKPVLQQAQQSLGVRLGDVAELDGVWQARTKTLHVVLSWRSLADHPAVDAKVFVHVVDENGQMVTQSDRVPLAGTRPLNTWAKDETLLDVYTLDLPVDQCATGCALQIGMYDPQTMVRLPTAATNGQLTDADAVIVPLAPWRPTDVQLRH